jgi:uncharacterized membrane protein
MIVDQIVMKPSTSAKRSLAKTVSWRVLGSIDTAILSYIITGNLVFAGSIASAEVVTKMILYFLHERAWAHVRWGTHSATVQVKAPEEKPAAPTLARKAA